MGKLGKHLDSLHHTNILWKLSSENKHIHEDIFKEAHRWNNWPQLDWFCLIFNPDFRVWI